MRNFLTESVVLVGALLTGYSLAYPVILAGYFYDKPQIDIIIYLLLFSVVFWGSQKVLSKYSGLKYCAFLLLIIPLAWFKLDYHLYAWLDSPQFVTYTFIILLGISGAALFKFPLTSQRPKWIGLMAAPFAIAGFLISVLYKPHDFNQFLVLCFSLGLAASFWDLKKIIPLSILLLSFVLVFVDNRFESPEFFERQSKYHDKVVFSVETDLQIVDVTTWKGHNWYFTDGINQFSSIDSWLYYEPFAYPAYALTVAEPSTLIIGGENGMLVHLLEALDLKVDLLPIDQELFELGKKEPLFVKENGGSLKNEGFRLIEDDVFRFLDQTEKAYDLIFIDVADPVDVERNQYFTFEFYQLIKQRLSENGIMVTQSGSPYFATKAFEVVRETMRAVGFETLAYHNQILTLGEWSWTLCGKKQTSSEMRLALESTNFERYNTQWLNQEAMQMMLSFGKPPKILSEVEINTIQDPVLYELYLQGNYEFDR